VLEKASVPALIVVPPEKLFPRKSQGAGAGFGEFYGTRAEVNFGVRYRWIQLEFVNRRYWPRVRFGQIVVALVSQVPTK